MQQLLDGGEKQEAFEEGKVQQPARPSLTVAQVHVLLLRLYVCVCVCVSSAHPPCGCLHIHRAWCVNRRRFAAAAAVMGCGCVSAAWFFVPICLGVVREQMLDQLLYHCDGCHPF